MRRRSALAAVALSLAPHVAAAAVTVFINDLAGFNATGGNPPVVDMRTLRGGATCG